MRTSSLRLKALSVLSLVALGGCGPSEATLVNTEAPLEAEADQALLRPPSNSGLTYRGTRHFLSSGYGCAQRSNGALVMVDCSATDAAQSFAVYENTNGGREFCVPDSLRRARQLRSGQWYEVYAGQCVEQRGLEVVLNEASVLTLRKWGSTTSFSPTGEAFWLTRVDRFWNAIGNRQGTSTLFHGPEGSTVVVNAVSRGWDNGWSFAYYEPCNLGAIQWCMKTE